jgi:pSer/pThr/pTyr-binding forkhead associated (FHA) protein
MAYLRVYSDKVLKAQHELRADRVTLGRAADNDIVLPGSGVSKHHAVIEKQGGALVLIDAESANGVMVNGKRIQRHILNFRDEIQIFQHTLIFMPLAKLPGEARSGAGAEAEQAAQDATVAVDISVIGDLMKQRKRQDVAFLQLRDAASDGARHVLEKIDFTIGRRADCDIQTGGWLAPAVAATLQRRSDGHFLLPAWRGRVRLNGERIAKPALLKDGDDLEIRGLKLKFQFRPLERH